MLVSCSVIDPLLCCHSTLADATSVFPVASCLLLSWQIPNCWVLLLFSERSFWLHCKLSVVTLAKLPKNSEPQFRCLKWGQCSYLLRQECSYGLHKVMHVKWVTQCPGVGVVTVTILSHCLLVLPMTAILSTLCFFPAQFVCWCPQAPFSLLCDGAHFT